MLVLDGPLCYNIVAVFFAVLFCFWRGRPERMKLLPGGGTCGYRNEDFADYFLARIDCCRSSSEGEECRAVRSDYGRCRASVRQAEGARPGSLPAASDGRTCCRFLPAVAGSCLPRKLIHIRKAGLWPAFLFCRERIHSTFFVYTKCYMGIYHSPRGRHQACEASWGELTW